MATHKLAILVSAIGAAKAAKDLKGVDKAISGIGAGAGRGARGAAGGIAKLGAVAAAAAVTGLAAAAKAAIDYQDAFQGVVKTVDGADLKKAGSSFEQLSDSIRKMSREMPNTAIELAGIAESAGALGIKAGDIEAFTKQVAILAATTNVSADDAATALGQLQNVIGLTGDEFDNFAAALVDLGNKGASTEADILEIARRSGGAAKLLGVAKDATLGWAAAAANLGLNAELAGTSLQNVYVKMLQKVSGGSTSVAKVFGKTAANVKKLFAKDASGALETFVRQLAKLPKAARLDAVQDIFGRGSGLTRLVVGLADSVDKNLTPALDTSAQAWKDSTAAAAEFEKRNSTVKSAFARLKNNIIDAAVTLGEGFAPALGRAADKLSKFLAQDGNRNKLKSLGEDIGRAIDSIDFDRLLTTAEGLVAALKPAAGILSSIAATIGKLPPELLGAGGALVITNKVTGGLVISGVEGVLGGLGKALAVGLASSIPVFGKAFVQPVFVTNMGPGGMPGGPGGGIKPIPANPGGIVVPAVGAAMALDLEKFHSRVVPLLAAMEAERKHLNGSLTGHGGPGRGNVPTPGLTGHGGPGRGGPANDVGKKITDLQHGAVAAIDGSKKATQDAGQKSVDAQGRAGRDVGGKVTLGTMGTTGAVRMGAAGTMNTVNAGSSRIVGAIAANRPIVTTTVNVNVSAAQVTKSTTTQERYGSGTGSSGSGSNAGYNDPGK